VGLEAVEFVLAAEEAFQIAIPDAAAEQMLTPRHVVDYVFARLGAADDPSFLEQRAFYLLRRASMRVFQAPRSLVTPATPWGEILPPLDRRHNWRVLHQATGTPQWPRLNLIKIGPSGKRVSHVVLIRPAEDLRTVIPFLREAFNLAVSEKS
jgi:hypothetical protein